MIGKPRQSKASNALYEHVLTKNFEIIQTFLSQFHELFQKQDQFEMLLGKIQQRVNLIEQNDRKMEDLLIKSNDMYQKKMKSLKQFILEKVKNSGQKIPINPPLPQHDLESRHQTQKQMFTQYEKQMAQQKKFEETISEHIKKIQLQLSGINQRVSSLTALTNNFDEKFSASLIIGGSFDQRANTPIQQIKNQLQLKMEHFSQQFNLKLKILSSQFFGTEEKVRIRIDGLAESIKQLDKGIKQKLSGEQFKQFQATYKDDQISLIKEIKQNFANRKQTKKMLSLLQKKMSKFEIVETTENQTDENKLSVNMPSNLHKRIKPASMHSHKKQPRNDFHIDGSMNIRRLSHRKFLQEKYF